MNFVKGLIIILAFLAIGYCIYLRIINPDMTQTRLFLTFWWQHLLTTIIVFPAYKFLSE